MTRAWIRGSPAAARCRHPAVGGLLLLVLFAGALSGCAGAGHGPVRAGEPAVQASDSTSTARPPAPLHTRMTPRDVELANTAVRRALETALSGTAFTWRNPENGHAGTVTPRATYPSKAGVYCREYEETLTIDGATERSRDTACRREDGTWQPVLGRD